MKKTGYSSALRSVACVYRRFLVSLVDASQRQARWILFSVLISTVTVAWYAATHLAFDTDPVNLLAPQLPFRQFQTEFDRAFPELSDLIVAVVDGQSDADAEEATKELAALVQQRPELFHSVYQPGQGPFFERHGLLYLDTPELRKLAAQSTVWAPLLAHLAHDPRLRTFFPVMGFALQNSADPERQELLAQLFRRVGETVEAQLSGRESRGLWSEALLGNTKFAGETAKRFLLVKPRLNYSSLQAADGPLIALRSLIDSIENRGNVTVRLTGSVVLEDEERQLVAQSAGLATLGAFLLVCLILAFGVRSFRLTVAILVTLSIGLIWTAAFATVAIGTLNLISATAPILFIGLGVDFGIQFAMRYRKEREGGTPHVGALRQATEGTGLALTLAAVAAAISFFSFLPTSYQGLAELGLIAAVGMGIALVANLTILPALLTLLPLSTVSAPAVHWSASLLPVLITRHRRGVLSLTLAGVGAAFFLLPRLEFDFNPLHLRSPSMESVRTFQKLASDPDTTPYTIEILANDLGAADELARRLESLPEVSKALTLASYVPGEQEEKLSIIGDLASTLQPITTAVPAAPPPDTPARLSAFQSFQQQLSQIPTDAFEVPLAGEVARLNHLLSRLQAQPDWPAAPLKALEQRLLGDLPKETERLRRLLGAGRVTLEDLPADLTSRYIAPDGRARVEVFPSEDLASNPAMGRFVRAVQAVAPRATGAPVEILEGGGAVVKASLVATGIAIAAGAALLVLALGNLRDTILVLLPLVLTAILTGASSALLGLSLNLANLVALPLLLGLGKAFGIYLIMRRREGLDTKALCNSSTPRAVLYSALTTMASFGTLAFADHQGMSSMGLLLSLTLGFALFSSLVVLPSVMDEMERWGIWPRKRYGSTRFAQE